MNVDSTATDCFNQVHKTDPSCEQSVLEKVARTNIYIFCLTFPCTLVTEVAEVVAKGSFIKMIPL
jgi:hypothetical protein